MDRNLTSEEKYILGEFADWSRLGTEYYKWLLNKDWDHLIPAIFKKFNDPKQLAFLISIIQDIVKNDKLLDYIDLEQYFKQYENAKEEFEKRGLITNSNSDNENSNGFIIGDISGEARYFAKPSSGKMWTSDLRGARIFKNAKEAQELIDDQLHMDGDFEVRPLAKAKSNRQDFIKVLTKYDFKKLTPAGTKWEKVYGNNFIKIIFGTAPSYKGIPAVHAYAYSEKMGDYPDEIYHSATELDKFIKDCLKDFGINESLNEAIDPSKALEVKKNSNADVIFYGYQYKNEDPVEIDPEEWSTEEYQNRKNQIVSDYNKLYADKPQANRYAKEHDFIFYALYNRKNESNEKDDNKMDEYLNEAADFSKQIEAVKEKIDYYNNQLKLTKDDSDRRDMERKLKGFYNQLNYYTELQKNNGQLKMDNLELKTEDLNNKTAGNKVTLEVMFEEYERYEQGNIRRAKVSGKDVLSALKKMVDKMGLYIDSDDIEEADMTAEEVIERIASENGDGCDLIFYIKNLTTGEMLLNNDYEDEEDWDDDYDEVTESIEPSVSGENIIEDFSDKEYDDDFGLDEIEESFTNSNEVKRMNTLYGLQ